MQTIYDWLSLALFCALAVLFLNRSAGPVVHGDRVLRYLPPAIGCAAANYLGNEGYDLAALLLLAASAFYVVARLRPGQAPR